VDCWIISRGRSTVTRHCLSSMYNVFHPISLLSTSTPRRQVILDVLTVLYVQGYYPRNQGYGSTYNLSFPELVYVYLFNQSINILNLTSLLLSMMMSDVYIKCQSQYRHYQKNVTQSISIGLLRV